MRDVRENLLSDLIDEIGQLIQSRIAAYIDNHADGSKAAFLNQFLVFPEFADYDLSLLKKPMKLRHEFDVFVSTDLVSVDLVYVAIEDDSSLTFHLEINLSFIDEDSEGVYVDLKNGQLIPFADDMQVQLQDFENDQLIKFTKKIRNFRTLSALKGS